VRTPAYGAVQPGTDLGVHARALRRVHDAVLGGASPPLAPRPLVARSWTRVMRLGLDPTRTNARDPLGRAEVERRRRDSALSLVIDDIRAVLGSVADASRFITVVTDPDGVILWREGSARVLQQADSLGFSEGATWTEDHVGTNAIGTALAEAAPVQLFSAEHFEEGQIPWYCTAAPLHDPRTGELLGVVDVSGPAETVHPTTVALVGTAVKLAEASLWRWHEKRLDALRTVAVPVLAAASAPGMVVDDHGWVAAVRGLPHLDRVAMPTADGPVAVPGLGLCVPEAVPGGWLLRPGASGRAALRLTLELDAHPPRAVVAGTNVWVYPLSTRHAEVLLLLARSGRTGMDAAALSTALYGHVGSLVTIRAEVSRLRKAIGGIVLARPYRLAPEVEVVLPDLAASPFAAGSTAPAVRALAGV